METSHVSVAVPEPPPSSSSSSPPSPPPPPLPSALAAAARAYAVLRCGGAPLKARPPRASLAEAAWAFAGCCAGIGALALLHYFVAAPAAALVLLTPAFAASAVLLYGVPSSPLAQPRNVVLGHAGSALAGVALRYLLVVLPAWPASEAAQSGALVLAGTLAVASSTSGMMLCGVTHPPGAATALIAVMGSPAVTGLGFLYVPLVTASALVLVLAALLVDNLSALPARRYPAFAL